MNTDDVVSRAKQALFHKVTQNTGYQLLGKAVTAITGLIIIKLVAQHYGQNGVGELTLIFNFITIFYLITDFGLNAIIVKKMIEHPDEEVSYYNGLLGLRIIASLLLAVIAMAILYVLPFDPITQTGYSPVFKQGTTLMLLTILSQSSYLTALTIFQRRLGYAKANIALAIGSIISCGSFYILALLDVPFTVALAAYVLGNTMTALVALKTLPITPKKQFEAIYSITMWKSFIVPALPLAAMLLLNVVYFKADSFILAKLKPVEDVGIYGLAYRIFEQALVVPIYFVNALYPILVEQVESGRQKLYRTLRLSVLALFGTGLLAGAALFIGAPLFVLIVGSSDFMASVTPLRILALGLPIFFISNIFLWLLVTLSKQKYLLLIYGSSMLVNVIGNLLFIPTHSYIAAAWLTTISETIVLIMTASLSLYFLRKRSTIQTTPPEIEVPITD